MSEAPDITDQGSNKGLLPTALLATVCVLGIPLPAHADPLGGFLDRFRSKPPYYRGWVPNLDNLEPVSGEELAEKLFGNAIRGTGQSNADWQRNLYLEIYDEDGQVEYYNWRGIDPARAWLDGDRVCYAYESGSRHCHLTYRYGTCYVDYAIDSPLQEDKPADPRNWHSIWAVTDDDDWESVIDLRTDFLLCDANLV